MLLLSMLHPPYFEPGSEEEKTYIENTFFCFCYLMILIRRKGNLLMVCLLCIYIILLVRIFALVIFREQSKEYVIYDVDDSGKEKERQSFIIFRILKTITTLEYKQWRAKTKPCNFCDCGLEKTKRNNANYRLIITAMMC